LRPRPSHPRGCQAVGGVKTSARLAGLLRTAGPDVVNAQGRIPHPGPHRPRPRGQEGDAVRWIAGRHAPDHIHLVAMLGRQDGTRPQTWNDYYRVGEARRAAEQRFGLRGAARPDRSAPPEIHCHAELSASGPAMGECRLRGVRCT
jgi:hypothetical protein